MKHSAAHAVTACDGIVVVGLLTCICTRSCSQSNQLHLAEVPLASSMLAQPPPVAQGDA